MLGQFHGMLIASAISLLPSNAFAQPMELWREPQDTLAAVSESDQYAWRVFVALNWPADVSKKASDPKKALGADGPVVWETWRSVFNSAPDTVFRLDGADPGDWLSVQRPAVADVDRDFESLPRQQRIFAAMRASLTGLSRRAGPSPTFEPGVSDLFGNEVRINKTAYEFVRANKLYNLQGQIAEAAKGTGILPFPSNSKAIKALWRQISEQDKPRYHWTEVKSASGETKIWGLTALHITTKDISHWLWATWEHVDNKTPHPPRPNHGDEPPFEGWQLPSRDTAACPTPPHDCDAVPSGFGLEGTKWANYRLRGTQVDFIDSTGEPILLANSETERGFQKTSSCMSCHADSAISPSGQNIPMSFPIGAPTPNKFRDVRTRQLLFMQLDFLWSLQRAQPTP